MFTIVDIQFLVGFIFVLVAGFLIGIERGTRGVPAGVRTHTLVCLGAMILTLASDHVDPESPARITASIVSGIGCLGAGIIMHHRKSIHGLTTAATIWLVAAIGIIIGYRYYLVAVLATLAAYFVLKLPHIGEHGEPDALKTQAAAPQAKLSVKPKRKR